VTLIGRLKQPYHMLEFIFQWKLFLCSLHKYLFYTSVLGLGVSNLFSWKQNEALVHLVDCCHTNHHSLPSSYLDSLPTSTW